MTEIKYSFDFSMFGFYSIVEQLGEQGCEINDEKVLNEIKGYDDLITSINFSQLMDVVSENERKRIFTRVAKRIGKIAKEQLEGI